MQRLRQLEECNDSRKKRREERARRKEGEAVREGWPDESRRIYAEEKIGKK